MGLDIYLDWDNQTDDEKRQQITGFHTSGATGYLRSSYNESGFNNWARRYIGGKDFQWIFGQTGESDLTPTPEDWDFMLCRCNQAYQDALKAKDMPLLIRIAGYHDVFKTEADILNAFLPHQEHTNIDREGYDWYSNHEGEFFFGKSPTVLAVMTVRGYVSANDTILVCKPDENTHQYYINLLANEVPAFIKLGKEKNARIEWSG